jgi:predicted regulator of Ras-like GTPase activity (Roadblock/LC7/MglB family)
MTHPNTTLFQPDYARIKAILGKMQSETGADLVLLINPSGQNIASEGPATDIDMTSLSSLAAASVAATEGLARLVGEREFSILYHQGRNRSLHISDLSRRFSLVLLLDRKVSLGLVRWKVKCATAMLEEVFRDAERNSQASMPPGYREGESVYSITDEELEKLFGNPGNRSGN